MLQLLPCCWLVQNNSHVPMSCAVGCVLTSAILPLPAPPPPALACVCGSTATILKEAHLQEGPPLKVEEDRDAGGGANAPTRRRWREHDPAATKLNAKTERALISRFPPAAAAAARSVTGGWSIDDRSIAPPPAQHATPNIGALHLLHICIIWQRRDPS
jgi:hypothetical protein